MKKLFDLLFLRKSKEEIKLIKIFKLDLKFITTKLQMKLLYDQVNLNVMLLHIN